MDQSKQLHSLLEVSDLLAMVEDLTRQERLSELSDASIAGLRITLRASRERLLESHAALSKGLVHSARLSESAMAKAQNSPAKTIERTRITTAEAPSSSQAPGNGGQPTPAARKDLKSALERFVDRQ